MRGNEIVLCVDMYEEQEGLMKSVLPHFFISIHSSFSPPWWRMTFPITRRPSSHSTRTSKSTFHITGQPPATETLCNQTNSPSLIGRRLRRHLLCLRGRPIRRRRRPTKAININTIIGVFILLWKWRFRITRLWRTLTRRWATSWSKCRHMCWTTTLKTTKTKTKL